MHYLMAWIWRAPSLFLLLVVSNNGDLQPGNNQPQKEIRFNPGYLNPDMYREEIASLVSAKERAQEMLYKNDIIAQLVTEMPCREVPNHLLISGNHKEVNRSFIENLHLKDATPRNCGGFDVYRLLEMVQRSRERAMMGTTVHFYDGVDPGIDSNTIAKSEVSGDETSSESPPSNLASYTRNDQTVDLMQLAEASKHLQEPKAVASSEEPLVPTEETLVQSSNQPLPTLLKFPLFKYAPISNTDSSVMLNQLGETANSIRKDLQIFSPNHKSQPESVVLKNTGPPEDMSNYINYLRRAVEHYNRNMGGYCNTKNGFHKPKVNS